MNLTSVFGRSLVSILAVATTWAIFAPDTGIIGREYVALADPQCTPLQVEEVETPCFITGAPLIIPGPDTGPRIRLGKDVVRNALERCDSGALRINAYYRWEAEGECAGIPDFTMYNRANVTFTLEAEEPETNKAPCVYEQDLENIHDIYVDYPLPSEAEGQHITRASARFHLSCCADCEQ